MFNVESYITQCIESLQNQSIPKENYEIIIVDDGSTDNSYKKASEFENKYHNIQIYRQENSGCSAARNAGLKLAKGRYIFFMDSDDYVTNNSLHEVLNCVLENDLDLLEFDWIRSEKRDLYTAKEPSTDTKLDILSGKNYIETKWIHDSVCTSFYKKEFLDSQKVQFKEGRLMEDMIFNAEIIPQAQRIAYFPFDIYRYFINSSSIWNSQDPKQMRKSIYDFQFMVMEFNSLRKKLSTQGIKTKILDAKIQIMLFNTFKRILKSNLNFKEITQITKELKAYNLYPLDAYRGTDKYRGMLTKMFNNKYLLFVSKTGFNMLKKPIDYFIIQKYKSNKEKKVVAP